MAARGSSVGGEVIADYSRAGGNVVGDNVQCNGLTCVAETVIV